ncbi:HAT family dimerization protein [Rhizoctonia solani AG-3 Rhs1AP]|uniref:HAT family dimerization protein n=2 Tax=Rhizoctonia solani AG-3 TaxID=1086053 RepID=A0A074RF79_9AGAM|nr:HAT family dimerization protein [Rhizoctonia solani AG-3 Rhs1AP]KEP45444.1 HAT family dimerization protein [Rhizoctonia solani 123E]
MTDSEAPPSLKRLRIDDPNDTLRPETAESGYPPPHTSNWQQDSKYAHCAHLIGRATKRNVADTPHFSKNTALVYQFLDMSEVVEDDAGILLSCNFHCGICGQGVWHWVKAGKSRGSTTDMNRHMQDRHNAAWVAAEQVDLLARSRANNQGFQAGVEISALEPREVGETFMDIFYKKLVQWIVMRNHPFTEIEDEDFQDLLLHLKPALGDHFIQADALRNRIFGHAGVQQQWLKSHLVAIPGLLAIACDAWTSSNCIAFLAITASWITDKWECEETLIDFRELHGAHTGQNMAKEVASVISELGIKDKGHIRCLPHVIHLAVMVLLLLINAIPSGTNIRSHIDDDSLFTEEDAENVVADNDREANEDNVVDKIDPMVNLKSACDKIRKISRIVWSSPQQMELFKTLAARIEEDNERQAKSHNRSYIKKCIKNLVLDIVTRWNSLYFMLERALEFREWTEDCAMALSETCKQYYASEKHIIKSEESDSTAEIINPNDFESAWRVGIPRQPIQEVFTMSVDDEIAIYLAEPVTHMDPLDWWRTNHGRFPHLASMARDFLSIPGSSVAVERVLSAGRDIISLQRASLTAETIRVLMTYRAALLLEKRMQRV